MHKRWLDSKNFLIWNLDFPKMTKYMIVLVLHYPISWLKKIITYIPESVQQVLQTYSSSWEKLISGEEVIE